MTLFSFRRRGVAGVSFLFLFSLLLFSLSGCGKPKAPPPQTFGPASPGISPSLSALFPHPENWAEPAVHGGWVALGGSAVCQQCHAGGAVDGAPSCASCHSFYPHAADWVKKENHGAFVLREGRAGCATQCHGADLGGGLSNVSCNLCHDIYPHTNQWVAPREHGVIAAGANKILCKGCHGEDFRGGGSGVSCYQCHEQYPHEVDWRLRQKHGAFVIDQGTAGCATQCHGADFRGGLSGVSCASCHAMFPHPAGWEGFTGHGEYVLAQNGVTTSCQGCHGADLRGGSAGVSCYSCHTSYPHPEGWRAPSQHGPMAYGDAKVSCATANCHGTAFEGSAQAPSCRDCHAIFPHRLPAWTTLVPGRESQRDDSFHGDHFIRRIQSGEPAACTECHGTHYDRVLGTLSCRQCHAFGITHTLMNNAVWRKGEAHGKFFSDHFLATDANVGCWKCHGNPVDFEAAQTQSGLVSASFCYQCHAAYPHVGWRSGGVTSLWEPVADGNCLPRRLINWAHTYYIEKSSLFADAQGRHPVWGVTPASDPLWGAAIAHTCGGTGSCHTAGKRSYAVFSPSLGGACATSCHGAGAAVVPLPNFSSCEPDPSIRDPGPPAVVATTPANGAQGVAGNAVVTIEFSEAMRESSFDDTGREGEEIEETVTILHLPSVRSVPGRISCDNNDWCKTVTVTPLLPLREDGSQYQVTVTTAVTDFDGVPMAADYTWTFNTTNVDVTPPVVLSTFPRNGQTRVNVTPVFVVEFNEPMQEASVTSAGAYRLTPAGDGTSPLPLTIPACVVGTDCRKVNFSSLWTLSLGTEYTVRVNTTVRDKAGNRLQNTHTFDFTTRYP